MVGGYSGVPGKRQKIYYYGCTYHHTRGRTVCENDHRARMEQLAGATARSAPRDAIVQADAFRLKQGENSLSAYTFGSRSIHHFFCKSCGIKPFGRGHLDGIGDFVAVNVACLDDATAEELAHAPVRYDDGRNNHWGSPPAETRHL